MGVIRECAGSEREARAFLCKKGGKERWRGGTCYHRDTLFRDIPNDPY